MRYPWLRELWQQLLSDAEAKRLPHAHCLPWRQAAASDVFLDKMVAWLMCSAPEKAACGHCKSCLLVKADTHPDLMVIGSAEQSTIGVDEIRKLTAKMQHTANQNGNKVAVIKFADKLTVAAANALLKTLEEPSEGTYLLLAAERPMQLLPTLRSRMRMHRLPAFEGAALKAWLETYAEQRLADDDPILRAWPGAPLNALAALKQRSGDRLDSDDSSTGAGNDQVVQIDRLWDALRGQGNWPVLTEKDDLLSWISSSEYILQDLLRVKQMVQPLRLHHIATKEIQAQSIRLGYHVSTLAAHLSALQKLRQQLQQQSGLNGRLLLRNQWLRWVNGE